MKLFTIIASLVIGSLQLKWDQVVVDISARG
jgi:hypothetical protein